MKPGIGHAKLAHVNTPVPVHGSGGFSEDTLLPAQGKSRKHQCPAGVAAALLPGAAVPCACSARASPVHMLPFRREKPCGARLLPGMRDRIFLRDFSPMHEKKRKMSVARHYGKKSHALDATKHCCRYRKNSVFSLLLFCIFLTSSFFTALFHKETNTIGKNCSLTVIKMNK
ncbi:hypothetical protein [uncultured Mailhella sp.]|uniref:hypothetical protein n=1 Tax=uncultured Mailhella sp. TaxID=1981031 RepID=UPI0025CE3219|nr:hypothetical protein [uncultured Mailhella sp.]